MHTQELITCFQDTLEQACRGELAAQTRAAADSSRIYPECFMSSKLHKVSKTEIRVQEGTSFAAARENLDHGRVAVLNFANPHYPGGGVKNGAVAQEECLCRSSNLYPCLEDQRLFADFYQYHRVRTDYNFSDRLIYTRDVTVFKDDSPVPQLLPREEWFRVDVITCAAPYLLKRRHVNRAVLFELFKSRIRGILEAAIDNGAQVLILGAFGCGAFGNPPDVVAWAFVEVLQEQRYQTAFERVVFAIRSSVGGDAYTVCPNLAAFQMAFYGESRELEKLRYVGGAEEDPADVDIPLPGGRVLCRGRESREFLLWQKRNPYFGKQFCVVGDSISTLDGFNPRGHNLFYTGQTCEQTGVRDFDDTWWGKVIHFFGGELLVNDAWSGSRVTRPVNNPDQFPSGCSDQRTENLHEGSIRPDVILVYMGVNDWGNGVALETTGNLTLAEADTYFSMAYGLMLNKLRRNYPDAKIWCCTIGKTCVKDSPDFLFPESFGGISVREYNHSIINAALANDCGIIDLFGQDMPYETLDGTHPTAAGMETLAVMALREMADQRGVELLGCGPKPERPDGFGDTRQAVPRYRDTQLRLQLTATGEELTSPLCEVTIGRAPNCDLVLQSSYVGRSHATFIRHGGQWYLQDNSSRNGTYLNGMRLEPEKGYLLRTGDRISFAQKEEAVFLE